MKSALKLLLIAALLATTTACERDRTSAYGFRLPDGDPQAGRETFAYMGCTQCHTVDGDSFVIESPVDDPYVELGGTVTRVKTYGELVTAIINPSHKLAPGYPLDRISEDGESNMYVYNQYLTVQELVDLVTYLQPFYDVMVPKYYYRAYP